MPPLCGGNARAHQPLETRRISVSKFRTSISAGLIVVVALSLVAVMTWLIFTPSLCAEPTRPHPTNDPENRCDANYNDCYRGCHQPANSAHLWQCLTYCEEKWNQCRAQAGLSVKRNPPIPTLTTQPSKGSPTPRPKASLPPRVIETSKSNATATPTPTPFLKRGDSKKKG